MQRLHSRTYKLDGSESPAENGINVRRVGRSDAEGARLDVEFDARTSRFLDEPLCEVVR